MTGPFFAQGGDVRPPGPGGEPRPPGSAAQRGEPPLSGPQAAGNPPRPPGPAAHGGEPPPSGPQAAGNPPRPPGPAAQGPEPLSPAPEALAAFYEKGYTVADPDEAERLGQWRALGARSKSGHVERLLRRAGLRPQTLVEIGCGDGALLEALARRGVASAYDGFELSAPAAAIAAGRGIPGAGRIEPYDGARVPAADGAYDLAVVSHVLEHVPDPRALLAEAARVARAVIVEVPLEDNESARRPRKRAEALRIGHIQVLSRADVHSLAASTGLRVAAELTDPLPLAHHSFFADTAKARAAAAAKWATRRALHGLAPHRAERLFTVHHAALLVGDAVAGRHDEAGEADVTTRPREPGGNGLR